MKTDMKSMHGALAWLKKCGFRKLGVNRKTKRMRWRDRDGEIAELRVNQKTGQVEIVMPHALINFFSLPAKDQAK